MEKEYKQDEIDLLQLLLKGVNIVRANFIAITLFFFLGVALGLTHYYTSKKVYTSKMVVSSGILTQSFSEKMFDNTKTFVRERNHKAIASQLNISEKAARSITSIKIESVISAGEFKEQDRFIITVEVFDQNDLPELQQGIVYYLTNNEFVRIRVEQSKSYTTQMIKKVQEEIEGLEQFKKSLYSGDFFQRVSGNLMFDPTTVNSKILDLTKEKINLENSLQLVNSVQIIEGFNRFERPTQPRFFVSLASGASIGLVLVTFLIAFKTIRKLVRMSDAANRSSK